MQVGGYVGVCSAGGECFLAVFLGGVGCGYGLTAASAELYPRLQVCRVDVVHGTRKLVGFPFGRAVAGGLCSLIGEHYTALHVRQSAFLLFVLHGFDGGRKGVLGVVADVIHVHRVAYRAAVRAKVGPVGFGLPVGFGFLAVVGPLLVLYAGLRKERENDAGLHVA